MTVLRSCSPRARPVASRAKPLLAAPLDAYKAENLPKAPPPHSKQRLEALCGGGALGRFSALLNAMVQDVGAGVVAGKVPVWAPEWVPEAKGAPDIRTHETQLRSATP